MDASELQPIMQFLEQQVPFSYLDHGRLLSCCRSLNIGYYSKASAFVPLDPQHPQLYIVRSGAFEIHDTHGKLLDRLGEGDYFGFPSLLSGEQTNNRVLILEDGLVYHITPDMFDTLRTASREFDRFFNRAFAKRLLAQAKFDTKDLTTTSRITALMSTSPQMIAPTMPIFEAAKIMRQARVSSILVVDNHKLVGILTDRDLRNRVLAENLDGTLPVYQAMTSHPVTIHSRALIFEAVLQMSEHNIHHLPVVENGHMLGIVTHTDILRAQSSQPLLLIDEIDRQHDLSSLILVSKQIPLLLQNLISADARAQEIGRVLTAVTDALTRRLIVLNQQILGQAPMAFCWLAFGSQGRQDQAACSDQDNGLLLAHEPDDAAKGYFDALTTAVCAGLDECGYVYCPGNIMAQNPQWRMSLTRWRSLFKHWINEPDPHALMHCSIFFDLRSIYGPASLFDGLQETILDQAQGNDIFLAALTGNALLNAPPLGFFRQFVLERDGSEVKGIDLKHKGSVLINDIVRIYALSAGIKDVNTAQRIRVLMEQQIIHRKDALDLADAHEFIAHMRLSNQGYQHTHAMSMTNYLLPTHLSSLMRHQLKDAFNVVHNAQVGLKLKIMRRY